MKAVCAAIMSGASLVAASVLLLGLSTKQTSSDYWYFFCIGMPFVCLVFVISLLICFGEFYKPKPIS